MVNDSVVPDQLANRKGAFQYLTLPIIPSDITFATGSPFIFR